MYPILRNVYPNETRPKLNSKNKKLNAQAYPPTVTNKERELKTQSDLILVILETHDNYTLFTLNLNLLNFI